MDRMTVINHNPEMKGMVELKTDIVFAEPDGEKLCMQMVKPMWKPEGKGFPLVVFIQGSAWTKPDQFWEIPQLSQLARKGFVVASVTHRSCFTASAPAFLVDVKTAIRFLRAHAVDYDIDKERVCAWGTSSGGNTALLLGMTGDDPRFETEDWAGESTRVQAVVDCFGPTDLMKMVEEQFKDAPPEDGESIMCALGDGKTPDEIRDRLNLISPIRYAHPGRDFPPFLMLHGDADGLVLYEDTETLYSRLVACGYDARLVRVTNAPHEGSFWSQPLLEIIFDFIQKQLG